MKMKKLAALALVVAMVAVPTFSFAARSTSSSTSSSSAVVTTTTQTQTVGTGTSGTSVPTATTKVNVAANGTTVSETGTTIDKSGTSIGLVVDTTTSTGTAVVSNGNGGITIGTVSVHFANGEAETAGLPTGVVERINKLNAGTAISEVLGTETGVDLTGFTALGNTRAVIAADAATGLTHTATEVTMVVDVPAGVEVAAVYYDNNTGRWVYVPVVVDPITKTVKLTVPGSCTLQLVKK